MKNNHYLSQFQKDQYASYLQAQLEKFSTFMLTQRKENQKYKHLQDTLSQHQKQLAQMKDQIQLIEVYQHQNLQNCQHINKKILKLEQLQLHLNHPIEDRCRQFSNGQNKQPIYMANQSEKISKQQLNKEFQLRIGKLEKTDNELSRRLKSIEDEITQNRELILGICKSKSISQSQLPDSYANCKDLKKMQKKMYQYFDQKFSEIERIFKKSERKRSKSPSFKTPVDYISSYVSSAEPNQKILSEFKINDNSVKSEMSTLSRETKKTSGQSRLLVLKKEKRLSSKSRSKSKSKSKKNIKKSKKNKNSSIQRSSISKSKSPSNVSRQNLRIKDSKNKQKSSCKSRRSSLSCDKYEKKDKAMKKKANRCPQSCGSKCI